MTDVEIQVKVAERCGYTKVREVEPSWWVWRNPHGLLSGQAILPDYPNDLNACAEMRKALNTTADRRNFCIELAYAVGNTNVDQFDIIDSTARQQCEAFLRVFGDWEENPG